MQSITLELLNLPQTVFAVKDNEVEYDVTVSRLGCVKVKAKSREEAMFKAEQMPTESITWNEDWVVTDAQEE